MNEIEKEIEYKKELKLFRKAMYLVERENLSGWSNHLLKSIGALLTIAWLLLLSLFVGDDLTFYRQVVNVVVIAGSFIIFIRLYNVIKLGLKWNQLKIVSRYKVDLTFRREKSQESVKI
jgi:peptidoglycan/LPS O-acetylase OafA/YrhL